MSELSNRNIAFPLLTIAVCIALTLPVLFREGMFMDAMLYTSVSHNLANGIGSFWFLQFSKLNVGELKAFHEQPPLVFAIQSIFFRVFGDSMYVERLYTFLTMSITIFLIKNLWQEVNEEPDEKKLWWFPVFLWIIIPVCFWSFSNTMHENTMGIFILLSVLLTLKSYRAKRPYLFLVLSGLNVFLATFCKGFPGFFPVAVPLIYWFCFRRADFKRALIDTAVILIIPICFYLLIWFYPPGRESLFDNYLIKRALHRITENPTADNRFFTLYRLATELIPTALAVCIIRFAMRKYETFNFENINKKKAIFFILTGLAGSLPLMLTMVQKGFYLVPSFPFFAIGLAFIVSGSLARLVNRLSEKVIKTIIFSELSILITVSLITVRLAGTIGRDRETLTDVYVIGKTVPKFSTLSCPDRIYVYDWSFQCYLVRYFNISVDPDHELQYFVREKSLDPKPPEEYEKINIATVKYELYRKKAS